MNRIAVVVPGHLKVKLIGTILSRPGFQTEFLQAPDATQLIRDPPQMLIVYCGDGGEGLAFLERLTKTFPSLKFPIVVFNKQGFKTNFPDTVKEVFEFDFQVDEFDAAIARLLRLPVRKSPRFLVRLGATVSVESQTMLATIIKISGSGCLLECNRKLYPGHSFSLEILGVPTIKIPPLLVSIVREEPPPSPGSKIRHFSAMFANTKLSEMEVIVQQLIG